ncbi:MAG: hypothetical protein HY834_00725 [Devosia nanyangense]|uniref:DUF5655 domain-containing protein n=1 Tax=Devosia nanyangense TaxID=1228055 RepID=A0A933KZA4_9HYPH|nr:hypothetical protein [Devosia nanyangense]
MKRRRETTADAFLAPYPDARKIYPAIARAVAALEGVTVKVQKSQIGFSRAHPFAAVWVPEMQLRRPAAPLVLSVFLRHRDPSPRWTEIVEPAPGRFTHHLELNAPADADAEVTRWLKSAWDAAE